MELKRYELADRGFYGYEFLDAYQQAASIQESSLCAEEGHLWLGVSPDRMHLSQSQVMELLPLLNYFVENGNLPNLHLEKESEEA
jgi:hypothetical protein